MVTTSCVTEGSSGPVIRDSGVPNGRCLPSNFRSVFSMFRDDFSPMGNCKNPDDGVVLTYGTTAPFAGHPWEGVNVNRILEHCLYYSEQNGESVMYFKLGVGGCVAEGRYKCMLSLAGEEDIPDSYKIGEKEVLEESCFTSPGMIDERRTLCKQKVTEMNEEAMKRTHIVPVKLSELGSFVEAVKVSGGVVDAGAIATVEKSLNIPPSKNEDQKVITKYKELISDRSNGLNFSPETEKVANMQGRFTGMRCYTNEDGEKVYYIGRNRNEEDMQKPDAAIVLCAVKEKSTGLIYVVLNKENRPLLSQILKDHEHVRQWNTVAGLVDSTDKSSGEAGDREVIEEVRDGNRMKAVGENIKLATLQSTTLGAETWSIGLGLYEIDKILIKSDENGVKERCVNLDDGVIESNCYVPLKDFLSGAYRNFPCSIGVGINTGLFSVVALMKMNGFTTEEIERRFTELS